MGKYFDVIDGMKFAWQRFLDLGLLKWSLVFVLGTMAISGILGSLGAMSNSLPVNAALETTAILVLLLFGFVVLPRVYFAAFSASSIGAKLPHVLDYALLSARLFLVNLSCWYDKKLLLPAAALLAASAACLLIGLFNNLLMLAFYFFFATGILAYAIGITVHSVRTYFAPMMLVHGDGPESVLARKSHDLAKGQTFEIFLAILALSLIIGIASLPLLLFTMVLSDLPYGKILGAILIGIFEWLYLSYRYVFFAKMYAFYAGVPLEGLASGAKPSPKKPQRKKRR